MWKPPEKIKYQTLNAPWPSEAEAAQSLLFSFLTQGRLELTSRTWIPAMVPWRAGLSGEVTPEILRWYHRFALGKPGALVVEATGIRDVPSGPLLRINDDRHISGLKSLVETVRIASEGQTKIFIQLIDFLPIKRRPARERFLLQFLDITDEHRTRLNMRDADDITLRNSLTACSDAELETILSAREWEDMQYGQRVRVTDTHMPAIRDLPTILPTAFAQAARRAVEAGFDGVELHYAHAYTMASFLSRLNDRADGYGGHIEGRLRLPLEVFHAVRAACPDDFCVGARLLSEETIAGGSELADTLFFAEQLARAGLDFLSLSRGGKFEDAKQPRVGEAAYPYTGRSGYECMPQIYSDKIGPFGRNRASVAQIKAHLVQCGFDVPIILAGGMHHFQQAEDCLATGAADVIGFARQALADPDWFTKVRAGVGDEVRLCTYSNYCEGLDQKHKVVTCQLWDREAREVAEAPLTKDGKRRTVAPIWQRPMRQIENSS